MFGPAPQIVFPPRDTAREEAWLRAWTAVAACFNGSSEAATRYADACLAAFDDRFPDPAADYRETRSQMRHTNEEAGTNV